MNTNPSTYDPYLAYEVDKSRFQQAVLGYVRQWKWILVSVLSMLSIGALYVASQTPVYEVEASVLIKDEQKGIREENVLKEQQNFIPKKVVENEIEILRSYSLISGVVEQLRLTTNYFYKKPLRQVDLYDASPVEVLVEKPTSNLYEKPLELQFLDAQTVQINGLTFPLNQPLVTRYGRLTVRTRRPIAGGEEPVYVEFKPTKQVVDGYVKSLKAEPTNKASTVVVLSLEDAVPRRGEAFLNTLIAEYGKGAASTKNQLAADALNFIDDRLKLIAGELMDVEKGIESFKTTYGITDLGIQSQLFLQKVQANDAKLNEVNAQLGALNDVEQYVRSKTNERGTAPATLGLSDPVLLNLVTKLNDLELQRDQLIRTTPEENPFLQSLDNQIRATRTSIVENIRGLKQNLIGTRILLTQNNQQTESQIRQVPGKERVLLNITRQQAIKNNLYTYLLQKREETAISYASDVADSRLIDAAHSGSNPTKPKKLLILLAFGLVGLVLPAGVLVTQDLANSKISQRSDVEHGTVVPILGDISRSPDKRPLVVTPGNQTLTTEQIHMLRTDVQFLRDNPEDYFGQVILVTSSVADEGKTFLALNLGASLALTHQATVVLETDLRQPKFRRVQRLGNRAGLSDYLLGEATLDDILQRVNDHHQLWMINCGSAMSHPTQLLTRPRLAELMQELRERFAYVVIDSPPVGFVSDAKLMTPFADTSLFVVRQDVTPQKHLRLLDALYRARRFPRMHVVLNGFDVRESFGNGYHKYITKALEDR
jgi:capsular exopolysaccharide synthesis family protein